MTLNLRNSDVKSKVLSQIHTTDMRLHYKLKELINTSWPGTSQGNYAVGKICVFVKTQTNMHLKHTSQLLRKKRGIFYFVFKVKVKAYTYPKGQVQCSYET